MSPYLTYTVAVDFGFDVVQISASASADRNNDILTAYIIQSV